MNLFKYPSISVFLSILVFLSIFSIFGTAHAGFILNHPNYTGLNQGLVGYWSFDGKDMAGTKAYDKSGNGNNGTITNGPVQIEGKLGQALSFDGGTAYVGMGDPASGIFDFTNSFAISFWVKTTQSTGAATYKTILGKGYLDGGVSGYGFFLNGDNGSNITLQTRNASTVVSANGSSINNGTWHHIVGIRNHSGNSTSIYIDGVLSGTGSGALTDYVSSRSFNIGDDIDNINTPSAVAGFNGQIDDVRIYNRALSADEIKRLYKIGGTLHVNTTNIGNNDTLKNGLVGYWSFDGKDMAGVTAYDKSGQNNNGTLTNGPVQIEGKLGQAMSFDGVNDYVSVLHNSSLNTPSAITISMWVKHTGTVAGGNRWLMSKGDFATGWDLANSADGGSLNFRFGASGNHSSSGNLMPFRQWAHIVITFDSSTQRVRFYSNTVLDSEISETGTISSNSTALDIATDSSASASFGGSIDDVRIYNRALNQDEIKRLYKIGGTLHVNTSNVGNNDTLKNGLVGYWSFDGKDMAGTKAYDKSGQNNNGTLTNGPTQIEGKIGQALNFDGVDDKVSVGSGNSLNITGDITISAWINKSALSNNAFPRIFERLVTNGYMLSIDDSSGTNNGIIFSAASTVSLSTTVIKPRTWQHIVVTLRSTTATLYVDGILSGSATTNPAGNNAGDTGWIGGRGLDNNRQFDGQIDDVRIYNRALNQNEIKRLYNLGR